MKIKILISCIIFLLIYNSLILMARAASPPPDMTLIKSGCFIMGTNEIFEYQANHSNDRERPTHEVCVSSYLLEKYEVSQAKWKKVMKIELNIHKVSHHGDSLPINRINWAEAKEYCARISRRLPTEAEWEYAARAGSKTLNYWGNNIDYDYLWFEGNSVRKPHAIGTKKPNSWGLYDMMGNVWEWVEDWYSQKYYLGSPRNNPKGPKQGSHHVIRGASWVDSEKEIRSAVRYPGEADLTQDFVVGFRCAKNIN